MSMSWDTVEGDAPPTCHLVPQQHSSHCELVTYERESIIYDLGGSASDGRVSAHCTFYP